MGDDYKLVQISFVIFVLIIVALIGLLIVESSKSTTVQDNSNILNENIAEAEDKVEDLEERIKLLENDLDFWPWQDFVASAYTINDLEQGTTSHNVLGWDLEDNRFMEIPQVAIDSSIIPLDTIIQILDSNEEHNVSGFYYTADIGAKIKGNRVDILVWSKWLAQQIGMRNVLVRIVGKGLSLSQK